MNAPFKNILNFVSRCENSNCTCPREILSHRRIFFFYVDKLACTADVGRQFSGFLVPAIYLLCRLTPLIILYGKSKNAHLKHYPHNSPDDCLQSLITSRNSNNSTIKMLGFAATTVEKTAETVPSIF